MFNPKLYHLHPQTKSIIQIIAATTLSLIMAGVIFAYFYVGYKGFPLYINIRFIFAAIIINSLGIIILANLATINQFIKKFLLFFLGIFLSIFLLIGFLKNSFNSVNEAYLALTLSLSISFLLILYFQTREKNLQLAISYFLLSIFFLFAVASLFTKPEAATAMQNYQTVFSVVALLGLLATFDCIRSLIKRYLQVDFSSPVSMTALVLAIFLLGFSLYVLLVFKSLGGLVNFVSKGIESLISPKMAVYQLLYFVILSFLAVGWLTRRRITEVLKRLGLVLPSRKDILWIFVFAMALYLANLIIGLFGVKMGLIDLGKEKEMEQLIFQNFQSFPGMLILAFAAGIGEEILFRGAIQSKLGIIFTALLFAFLHGQYQIFGLLTVFILGLILGYQRKISNTTSTIISHFLYDMIELGLIFLLK